MDFQDRHIPDDNFDEYLESFFINDTDISKFDLYEKQLKTTIQDKDTGFILDIDTSGFDKDEITIYIEQKELVVEGKRQDIIDEEYDIYIKQESSYSYCRRVFSLEGIQRNDIKATYENGHIHINLPKIKNTIKDN